MKQGDLVKWIFGPDDENAVAIGTILHAVSCKRWAVFLQSQSVQYFKEEELRIIQATE